MRICAVLLASVLVALSAPAAGVRGYVLKQEIVTRSRRRDGTPREVVKRKIVYLAGDRVRVEDAMDESFEVTSGEPLIVRLGRGAGGGEQIELDDVLENYERKTFKKLRAQWKSLNAWHLEEIEQTPATRMRDRAELIDDLSNAEEKWQLIWKLPAGPERERLVGKYNLPPEPPVVKVRSTEERKNILGKECCRYEATENDLVTDSAWIAPELRFDGRYYEFMELWGWIGKPLAEALRKVRGLPLLTSMRTRTGVEVELRTKSIEEKELDPSLFEVPPGYRERKRKSAFR